MQDVLDIWLKVQGVWQYLEPIFGSEDIMRQMPKEGKLFKRQDGMWRRRHVAREHGEGERGRHRAQGRRDPQPARELQGAARAARAVQKGLNDYLEVKRLFFPRFFFLSNDELLEILSETKDPTRVQPHLGKCFDGIGKLQFRGDANIITAMISPRARS